MSAPAATCTQVTVAAGTPRTPNSPASVSSMSSTAASSSSAARSRACSSTFPAAACTALPPSCSERDPPVPPPRGTSAVSDWTNVIFSSGIPSRSATSIENAVGWPWPCPDVPAAMVAVPSACTVTEPNSPPPPAVISTYTLTPMPSCTRSPAARRAACSARSRS